MDKPQPNWVRVAAVGLAWYALLFIAVAGLSLYAASSSFPAQDAGGPRQGMAAFHESVGTVVMTAIHGPFSRLYDYMDGKVAGLLVWLLWAGGLFGLSALLRWPRWVFSARRGRHPS